MSELSSPSPAVTRAPSRGFQPLRDLPTVLWLVLVIIVSFTHRTLPVPGWIMLHLLLLGAITHAILVWSQHFSFALTRTPHTLADRRTQNIRLVLANLGAALVLVGVPSTIWALTLSGSALLVTAVIWHGLSIMRRTRRALSGRFTRTTWYYVVSAACLAVGASIGAWLAGPGHASGRFVLAHMLINLLGWVGITVAGTIVTLWPTMLRTRADAQAAPAAAIALPVLAAAVLVAAGGAAFGALPVLLLGLVGYAAGLCVIGVGLVRTARNTPPRSFATLSAGAAMLWWFGGVIALAIHTVAAWAGDSAATASPSVDGATVGGSASAFALGSDAAFGAVLQATHAIAPFFAAGFAAQVLLGALSYLVPVVTGGGPTPVRIGTAVFDRMGPLRVATANVALLVCALPVPSVTRVAASLLYLIAMASFVPLLFVAIRQQSRAKHDIGGPAAASAAAASAATPAASASASTAAPAASARRGPIVPEGTQPTGRRAGQAVAGLLAVTLVVALSGTIDPHSLAQPPTVQSGSDAGGSTIAGADAPVQTVQVTAADMRFTPNHIEVPTGTRLVIELTNADDTLVHDLVFANGVQGSRLAPGNSERIDVGVITADLAAWCSIIGHRQMGMTLDIVAVGAAAGSGHDPATPDADPGHGDHNSSATAGPSAADLLDFMRKPSPTFEPMSAELDPLPPQAGPVTHRIELPVTEVETEIAPGVRQLLWTFGGTAPGPVLHGRVGDTFEVTLVNDGTIGHSIDFHAGALAPDQPMRTIAPGESLVYRFTATRSGIWMYHCSTMPMSAHIANGMYGAVVIEPNDLPSVDRSYLLVQGEYYLGPQGGEVDMDRLATAQPDVVAFNGYANQYDHAPLPAAVGERVRVWLLDAGPNRASSFHVVGGQFDTVWSEGRYLINRAADTGSQALALQPAQGGFVELVFPEVGNYPFVSHIMVDAERGAHGIFRVK